MKLLRLACFYGWLLAIISPLHAAPMGFNIAIGFDNPITLFGTQVDRMDGMMFGDPVPGAGSNVLDCFGPFCEIDSLMLDISNGGMTQATLELTRDMPLNMLGQMSGTLSGGFGSFDVAMLFETFAYVIVGGPCSPHDDVICQGEDPTFTLLQDLTDDGASVDDIPLLMLDVGSAPNMSGVASPIEMVVSQMQTVCAPCGSIDIDPKTLPEPGMAILLALGFVGFGLRGKKHRARRGSPGNR